MKSTAACFAFLLGSLVLAGPAHADARSDLKAAYGKFIQANSFRATMTDMDSGKAMSKIEFLAPDRFAVTPTGGVRQVIIGRMMHIDVGGRTMAIALPAQIDPGQYRNQKALEELSAGLSVTQRADSSAAGEPARVYHFVSKAEGEPVQSLTFVSKASGLPIQIETSGSDGKTSFRLRIRYSHFNDPSIKIAAPK